jgi:hypothetical protein
MDHLTYLNNSGQNDECMCRGRVPTNQLAVCVLSRNYLLVCCRVGTGATPVPVSASANLAGTARRATGLVRRTCTGKSAEPFASARMTLTAIPSTDLAPVCRVITSFN